MGRYLVRRLLLFIPTLFVISVVAFGMMHLIPGDTIDAMLGPESTLSAEARETLSRQLGFDQPVYVQYGRWVLALIQGDLGVSLRTGESVASIYLRAFPTTLELTILSTVFGTIIAIPLGVISAVNQNRLSDYLSRFFGLIGLAIPNFWLAILLILVTSFYIGWSPPLVYERLWTDPTTNLKQMMLPSISLGVGLMAVVMRMTRSSMLEVIRQDYIRTARAKGLSERPIVFRHALKNAFIPVITVIGFQIGYLLGGAVVIEQIFGLPGIGWMLLNGINQRDYPVVQAGVLILTLAFALSNLIVDLLYAVLDPRIRYD